MIKNLYVCELCRKFTVIQRQENIAQPASIKCKNKRKLSNLACIGEAVLQPDGDDYLKDLKPTWEIYLNSRGELAIKPVRDK